MDNSYDNEKTRHRLRIIDSNEVTHTSSNSPNQRRNYRIRFINDEFITREEAIIRYGRTSESRIGKTITLVVNKEKSKQMKILNSENVISSRKMFMGRPLSSFTSSEIDFLREKSKREQLVAYERKVSEIISSIPKNFQDEEKLRAVFNWFLKNTTYYQDYPKGDGFTARSEYQEWNSYPPELSLLDYNTKEGAILTGCSVCGGLSEAFKDVVNRLGISCDCVHNDIHGWNVVYKGDREYYIDVSQAVPYKNKSTGIITPRFSTNSNFLVSIGELNKGPYPHNNGRIDEIKTRYVR